MRKTFYFAIGLYIFSFLCFMAYFCQAANVTATKGKVITITGLDADWTSTGDLSDDKFLNILE